MPLNHAQRQGLDFLIRSRRSALVAIRTAEGWRAAIKRFEWTRDSSRALGDRKTEALAQIDLEGARDALVDILFQIVGVGQLFIKTASHIDYLLPRDVWLRALSVNESLWDSPDMLEDGNDILKVVYVLNLENSATKDNDTAIRPLNWCCSMAMLNAIKTNVKLGEAVHEEANQVFGGVFGEYQEPTILQRLGVRV